MGLAAPDAAWNPSCAPYSCMRTFTRSIGCVTAPESIAPVLPATKPFQGACFFGA